ncbi:MAG: hypothetical protein WDA77_11420 [Acidimicrobiia bacterium]
MGRFEWSIPELGRRMTSDHAHQGCQVVISAPALREKIRQYETNIAAAWELLESRSSRADMNTERSCVQL